ncbi:MAG: metallophosphoesterase [Flavobacteriales bacterium]|nr:metallophosphoesterase [Flavobacteriales bacterium]
MQSALISKGTEVLKENLARSIDANARAYFIKSPGGRRLVTTDIHGSYQTFMKLIKKIKLSKSDQLFILGDFINRAPYSIFVIEHICELLVKGYQIFPLRGNHEQLVLDFALDDQNKLKAMTERQYSKHLLKKDRLPKTTIEFFETLPFYYELEDYYLVHAGFDTGLKKPLKGWKEMLWIRSMNYNSKQLKDKTVIHGHVPTPLPLIEEQIVSKSPEIALDNGCIRAGVYHFGNLVCLDLDSREYLVQKNIDFLPA